MFEHIYFHGQFRTYQQKILDGAQAYLSDNRIHIVAAPGSGKTILGLELIRRRGKPCIILSPTTTIRDQWGERFIAHFLSGEAPDAYLSYDLNRPALITSVTYQALHAAMHRAKDEESGEDYAGLDLLAEIGRMGIGTICLDEAHHLQNEWQKSLESFLAALKGQVKVIALTATPPYDAKPNEWERYIGVCGEIDEEIFVPELVQQHTLCPHQDYLYFSYPTQKETAELQAYHKRVDEALQALFSSDLPDMAYQCLLARADDLDDLFAHTAEHVALLVLCRQAGVDVSKKIIRKLTGEKHLSALSYQRAERAVNYLTKGDLLPEKERERLVDLFRQKGLTERGEVALDLNEKCKKRLIASAGKLDSIAEISRSEAEAKGEALRLLILTDFIKKETLSVIGSDTNPDAVSVVSAFETVRRTGVSVGALSGSLVILPAACADMLADMHATFSISPLGETGYCVFDFPADNREKVRLVSRLFEQGAIHALVGTKSLLGEGWDAPCVNALILASFVGSFMLSNQMRGRAIRTDKNDPNKTANIWHLVSVERPPVYAENAAEKAALIAVENKNELVSCDFDTIKRRFDCFVAPNYETGEIESGIARVTILQPPFDEKGIARINREMLARAKESAQCKQSWETAVRGSARLNEVSEVPKAGMTPPFLFFNVFYAVLLDVVFSSAFASLISVCMRSASLGTTKSFLLMAFLCIVCIVAAGLFIPLLTTKILAHLNPTRSVRTLAGCILATMQELEMIGRDARVMVAEDGQGICISVELLGASVHDQNLFHNAIAELLSPIRNPRYLLIRRGKNGRLQNKTALACPEILGSKNQYAACLAGHLKRSMGDVEPVYTRTEEGHKLMLVCKRTSYITRNHQQFYGRKKHISRWE